MQKTQEVIDWRLLWNLTVAIGHSFPYMRSKDLLDNTELYLPICFDCGFLPFETMWKAWAVSSGALGKMVTRGHALWARVTENNRKSGSRGYGIVGVLWLDKTAVGIQFRLVDYRRPKQKWKQLAFGFFLPHGTCRDQMFIWQPDGTWDRVLNTGKPHRVVSCVCKYRFQKIAIERVPSDVYEIKYLAFEGEMADSLPNLPVMIRLLAWQPFRSGKEEVVSV